MRIKLRLRLIWAGLTDGFTTSRKRQCIYLPGWPEQESGDGPYLDGRYDGEYVDHLKQRIPALEQQGWVSVEERLPEFNVRVWVWDGEIAGTDVSNNILGTKVTHWRPLPAPPSQEQESGE